MGQNRCVRTREDTISLPKAERRRSVLAQDRSVRARATLVEAAAALCRTRSFDDVSVAEICARAGVAKGSYYFYFERKEDLLLLVAGFGLNALMVEVKRPENADLPLNRTLKLGVDALARAAETFPRRLVQRTIVELYRSVQRMGPTEEAWNLRTVFTALFARARRRGEISSDCSSEELAAALAGVVLHTLWLWSIDRLPGRRSLAGVLMKGVELILDNVVTADRT